MIQMWRNWGIDRAVTQIRRMEIFDERPEWIHFQIDAVMGAPSMRPILQMRAVWTICEDGQIRLSADVHVREDSERDLGRNGQQRLYLPRFGIRLILPEEFDQIEYFGYGPGESYVDKHRASYKSHFSTQVDQMFENYLKPQENGAHYDTEWMCCTNRYGMGIEAAGDGF